MSNKTTPMMRQYNEVKRQHPNDIVFFRMGDFYEMMFEDAVTASAVLDITLTKRGKGTASEAPMCGVPFHAAEGYISKLVRNGYRVAICDQVEDAKNAKGLVRREVVRVVTPGTILDHQVSDHRDFQYLAAIVEDDARLGLAFVEFSTGRFEVCQFEGEDRLLQAGDILSIRDPAELVVEDDNQLSWLDPGYLSKRCITRLDGWRFTLEVASKALSDHFEVSVLDGFGLNALPLATGAAGAALSYLSDTQKSPAKHIEAVHVLNFSDHLIIDGATQRNLELTRSLFDGNRSESLLGQIDLTKTAMGARLLKEWILRPLMELAAINERQTAIASYIDSIIARGEIRTLLGSIPDMDRVISKLAIGTVNPRDLVGLSQTLGQIPDVLTCLDDVVDDRYGFQDTEIKQIWSVHERIEGSLLGDPPTHLRAGGVMADGLDAELDELRALRRDSRGSLARIEARERDRTNIPKLKIQFNKVFGYYIEVSKAHAEKVPDDYQRKQTLVNSERYITDELKEYEAKILGAEERILELELRLFGELVAECTREIPVLRHWSQTLALIDVHAALAELAVDRNYCRPQVNEAGDIVITDGRHPVVESLSNEPFIANDTMLNMSTDRVQIITGPNMGGKSTYLRQVALITLMAQMGSFVPAREAEIGIVDRIFTRVGASDQLARGQSTFMVEMTETAHILHHASDRSLIILDEVGRGTSTFDGLSIAWAAAEYICDQDRIGAKTLFATHYHEMTELARTCEGVRNLHITVREWKGDIVFLRRVEQGAADQSYGIHVAKLAGLPKGVIRRAREVLANLERNELDTSGRPKFARGGTLARAEEDRQLPLFETPRHPLVDELEALEPDDMTPRQALDALYRLKETL